MKGKSTRHIRITEQLIWIGLGLGALWWVLEACVHVFVFHDRTLIGQLLSLDPHELWMRSLVAGLLLIFSAYAQSIVNSRRRAEEATKHAYVELNQIFNTAADGMRVVDKGFKVLRYNQTFLTLSGVSESEAASKKCYEAFPGTQCHTPECSLRRVLDVEDRVEFDVEKERSDGTKVSCIVTATPFRGPDEQLIGIVEDFKDITDRKHAEEALKESEKKYKTQFEEALDAIFIGDAETGILIDCNHAGSELVGRARSELVGKHQRILHPPEELEGEFSMTFKLHLKEKAGQALEAQVITKNGEIKDVSITANIFELKGKKVLQGIFRDITAQKRVEQEKKRLEAQFEQAQKMEAIGTLAGGIAHDFNNLLTSIQGNASLMLMDIDYTHPYYKRLRNIEKQVQSGARLTSHLLGYARKGRYEVKPVDLNQLVEENSGTFGRTRKEIRIHRELAEDLFAIEADPWQIEQVLLNLFVNAADAMPGGGDLILKTMNTTHEDMKGKLYDPKPGSYVLLTVTDTGTGMDTETMERIFDPFFTTKEMGRGTGLGLASAYGIIKGHGGYVDVQSKKGHGTTFSIYLPVSEKKFEEAVKADEQFIRATGNVLLVDDEDDVLEIAKELLEVMGYRVLTAKDGKEAIEVYGKNRDDIDFVLLDMIMPGMGGGETYDKMKEINPDVKVLLSSGYSIDGQATDILERGCDGFIQKPFTMKELSQSIRDVMGKQ